MTRVTPASIAYTATQVKCSLRCLFCLLTFCYGLAQLRFALTSSSVFCRSDTSTDSERFYNSVLDFLDDPNEKDDVDALIDWWNWYVCSIRLFACATLTRCSRVFPSYVTRDRGVSKHSALARLKEKRAAKRAALGDVTGESINTY